MRTVRRSPIEKLALVVTAWRGRAVSQLEGCGQRAEARDRALRRALRRLSGHVDVPLPHPGSRGSRHDGSARDPPLRGGIPWDKSAGGPAAPRLSERALRLPPSRRWLLRKAADHVFATSKALLKPLELPRPEQHRRITRIHHQRVAARSEKICRARLRRPHDYRRLTAVAEWDRLRSYRRCGLRWRLSCDHRLEYLAPLSTTAHQRLLRAQRDRG